MFLSVCHIFVSVQIITACNLIMTVLISVLLIWGAVKVRTFICYIQTISLTHMEVSYNALLTQAPNCSFAWSFQGKNFVNIPISSREATCFTHVTRFDLILLIFGQQYTVCSSSLWYFLQPPVNIFLLLGPDFVLTALFPHPQSITFFARNCFRHIKIVNKIAVLNSFIITLLHGNGKTKYGWQQAFPKCNHSLISS